VCVTVQKSIVSHRPIAALCTNGWFFRRAAAPNFTLTQHIPRCERTQRTVITSASGSQLPLAASCTNDRFAKVSVVTF
jgi:hypothetical protein